MYKSPDFSIRFKNGTYLHDFSFDKKLVLSIKVQYISQMMKFTFKVFDNNSMYFEAQKEYELIDGYSLIRMNNSDIFNIFYMNLDNSSKRGHLGSFNNSSFWGELVDMGNITFGQKTFNTNMLDANITVPNSTKTVSTQIYYDKKTNHCVFFTGLLIDEILNDIGIVSIETFFFILDSTSFDIPFMLTIPSPKIDYTLIALIIIVPVSIYIPYRMYIKNWEKNNLKKGRKNRTWKKS